MCEDDPEDIDISLDETDAPPELIGEYTSLDHYFRAVLEEFMDPGARWLLDCLDMALVGRHFDGDRYRHELVDGRVYRRIVAR